MEELGKIPRTQQLPVSGSATAVSSPLHPLSPVYSIKGVPLLLQVGHMPALHSHPVTSQGYYSRKKMSWTLQALFCKTPSKIDQNTFGKTALWHRILTMLSLAGWIISIILLLHEALIISSEMLTYIHLKKKKRKNPASTSTTKWHKNKQIKKKKAGDGVREKNSDSKGIKDI